MEQFTNDPWSAVQGLNLSSAEAHVDLDCSSDITHSSYVFQFILSDPEKFIALTSNLPPFVQDVVFQYYFLGRVQEQIKVMLGCNKDSVWPALQLARKAIAALACDESPEGIEDIWRAMSELQRKRSRDLSQLKITEPGIIGKFKVHTDDDHFESLFAPETMEGSIMKAAGC